MDVQHSPAKRVKLSPPAGLDTNADFVAFDQGDDDFQPQAITNEPQQNGTEHRQRFDSRERHDRPKSKHALPDNTTWVLIKTKLGRRFVHNVETKQSLWRIPRQLQTTVEAFDYLEEQQKNARWSETQLKTMRQQQAQDSDRRRRSVSLQREDEEAMMAELAAQEEHAEEQDAKQAVAAVSSLEPRGYIGEASDSEYEYVEVTDTEGEGSDEEQEEKTQDEQLGVAAEPDGPVDFGEDDIAYQLAMMGESYGLDPEEYQGDEDAEEYDQEADGLELTNDEAVALFHQMLDDHGISPFVPWEKLISDVGPDSIAFDERYTTLASSRARKEAWDRWSRDRAAQINVQRAAEEKKDPRIVYLRFLANTANTKLYWPEFKRKYKREPEMNDRALQDRDREKLYRELVAKMKLPESKRKDELKKLLTAIPKESSQLPEKILTNVALYALSPAARNELTRSMGFEVPNW